MYSETFDQHISHLREVFERLRCAGLTVRPDKVVFATQEIAFVGHKGSPAGVSIDPDRTRAIKDFSPPKDVAFVSRFIGMVNFYHKFIPSFADVAAPLNQLRRNGESFLWGPDQQKAFEALKHAISHPPILKMVDFSKEFILQTDASSVAVGAVLLQEHQGVRLPVAYSSRTLSVQERRASSIYELECLAVLFGFDKFRKYLEHQEFLLETDNQALSWLLAHPRQLGKIGRWIARISSFKFRVQHIRGTQNVIADTLSHMFMEEQSSYVDSQDRCNVLTSCPMAFEELGDLQRADQELSNIIGFLEKGQVVPHYQLHKGILCYVSARGQERKIVAPTAAVPMIFEYFHCSPVGGHLGVFKTLQKIREKFTWKNMARQIRKKALSCQLCSMSKPAQNTKMGMLASDVAQRPLKKLFIDYVGKLLRTKAGNNMLLVCVDAFTKFVWLIPVREATTAITIKALRQRIFSSFSVPEIIVSDNASCFVSRDFQVLFQVGHSSHYYDAILSSAISCRAI